MRDLAIGAKDVRARKGAQEHMRDPSSSTRLGMTALEFYGARPNTTHALIPPKPKELLIT